MASSVRPPASVLPPPAVRPSLDAFFSYGFRPFFLGSALYAVLAMAVWIVWLATANAGGPQDWLPVAGSPFAWHAHEMVFGVAAAAVAGFLLTAVPNWTGALPLSGPPLVLLFVLWSAGRVAMAMSATLPYEFAAIVDLVFLPAIGAFAARQLLVRPAPRKLVFVVPIAAMTAANLAFHLANAGYVALDALSAARISLLLVIVMIAIIGGRIIPAFTHNWLHGNRAAAPKPQRIPWLDAASILSIAVFAVVEAFMSARALTGMAALAAALFNGARLVLWRGPSTAREPIVWILHLGYAWIVIGLVLAALAAFGGLVSGTLALHAFGTGAVGTMIMAVMSRASLGHTGRRLIAPRSIVWAYHLVTLAAVLRVAGPLVAPGHSTAVLTAAGLAWIGAFAVFTVVYAPILTTPRVHTKLAHP